MTDMMQAPEKVQRSLEHVEHIRGKDVFEDCWYVILADFIESEWGRKEAESERDAARAELATLRAELEAERRIKPGLTVRRM